MQPAWGTSEPRKKHMLSDQARLVGEVDFKQQLKDEGEKSSSVLEGKTRQGPESLSVSIWVGHGEETADENLLERQVEGDYGNL